MRRQRIVIPTEMDAEICPELIRAPDSGADHPLLRSRLGSPRWRCLFRFAEDSNRSEVFTDRGQLQGK